MVDLNACLDALEQGLEIGFCVAVAATFVAVVISLWESRKK